VATAVIAPLVWGTTISLALGQAAMLAVGLMAFLVYLRIAPRPVAIVRGEEPDEPRVAA
jgi:hypothetical protein